MNLILLSSTSFGEEAGNYDGSSSSFSSDGVKGKGYNGITDGLHTVIGSVDKFVGIITIQGTLTDTSSTNDNDWFDIANLIGDGVSIVSNSAVNNFTVNATYIRARVTSFTAGHIKEIRIKH